LTSGKRPLQTGLAAAPPYNFSPRQGRAGTGGSPMIDQNHDDQTVSKHDAAHSGVDVTV
jgi:hypothetical protein